MAADWQNNRPGGEEDEDDEEVDDTVRRYLFLNVSILTAPELQSDERRCALCN